MSWQSRSPGKHKFEVIDGDDAPGEFDHLVIDTPARTEPEDLLPLAKGSDLLLIPSSISIFSLEATIATLKAIPDLPKDKYAVVLTFLPPRGRKREQEAREALASAGVPVLAAGIQQRVIYQDAAIEGLTFNHMRGESAKAAWAEVQALGKEIVKGWGQ
jgi:chromosome partitioning protein